MMAPKQSARPEVSAATVSAENKSPLPASSASPAEPPPRELSAIAKQALAEAEERRRQAEAAARAPTELGGRQGPDPVRYGDWENGGIASDF